MKDHAVSFATFSFGTVSRNNVVYSGWQKILAGNPGIDERDLNTIAMSV